MFSPQHFIWLAICVAVIVTALMYLMRRKPPLSKVLTVCCVIAAVAEVVKTFSKIQMVPSADGTILYPYIEMSQVPFHLCSLQIIFMFYCRFARDSAFKDSLLAFMYPSCAIGAFAALMIPTLFSDSISLEQAFTHPQAYEYFLYHAVLVILGVYIGFGAQVKIRPGHYLTSLAWLGALAFISLYVNSMLAAPTYENGTLISVDNVPNFFFTYDTPIGIALTQMWHWYVYLGILLVLACGLVALFYIPVFRRGKKKVTI